MKVKPDAVVRAIKLAKAIGSKIDPSFGSIPMPIEEGEGVPLERARGGGLAQRVRMPLRYPKPHMADGGVTAGRSPELQSYAQNIGTPDFDQEQYHSLIDQHKPVRPYESVPVPATEEDMLRGLTTNKHHKINAVNDYQEGHPVGLRLDIPAYTKHGVWVPTMHDLLQGGKSFSHQGAAHITDATFDMPESQASAVAKGRAKSPFAHIDGRLKKTPVDVIHEMAKAALDDPQWVQVGMDPERHSYFYDRANHRRAIHRADEVLQVGPLVLAKNPVFGDASEHAYEDGGRVGYDDGGGIFDTISQGFEDYVAKPVDQYVVQPAKNAATAVGNAVDQNIVQPFANAFAPPPPPKPKVVVSLVGANPSFPEGTAPGWVHPRFNIKDFRGYRPDVTDKYGGHEGIETLPNPNWRNSPNALYNLYNYARIAGAASKYGLPTIDLRDLAAMGLAEGDSVYGYRGYKPNANAQGARYNEQLLSRFNLDPQTAQFLGLIAEKHRESKRLNLPFFQLWNGNGTSVFGKTGAEYNAAMVNFYKALEHKKNKQYYDFLRQAYEEGQRYGFTPAKKGSKKSEGGAIDGRFGYATGGSDDDDAPIVPDELPSDFYAQPSPDLNLYSKAADLAHNAPMKRAAPSEWKNYLLKKGVRPAEFKWSDFDRKFAPYEGEDGEEPVSREEIAAHFHRNMPSIAEKHFEDEDVHYPDWTMPGGDNYREILLHEKYPHKVLHQTIHWEKQAHPKYDMEDEHPFYGEELEDTPNVYVHTRVNDRKTHDDKDVLHLEEMQSDWGQEARKGFGLDDPKTHPDYKTEASQRLQDYYKDLSERLGRPIETSGTALLAAHELSEVPTFRALQSAASEESFKNRKIANLPLEGPYIGNTNDWTALGVKNLLTRAAREGHDYVSWTPGQEQVDRYGIEKHVGQIHYGPHDEGSEYSNGRHKIRIISPEGHLIHSRFLRPEELAGYFGKDIAQKIINGEGEDIASYTEPNSKDPTHYPQGTKALSSLDFKTGGEGMRKFYDEILPKQLLKLARMHDPEAEIEYIQTKSGHPFGQQGARWNGGEHTLPALRMTPRMRESILRHGFAAHAHGGAVEGYEDGGSVEDHPLTNPVYHGVKGPTVSSDLAHGLDMEMFDREHPGTLEMPQDKTKFFWKKDNRTSLMLGPHVSRDPNIAGDPRFTTDEWFNDETGERKEKWAKGKVMPLNTFPDEKFFPVEQHFWPNGQPKAASYDDKAVHNTVYADILQNNPKLAHEILTEYGLDDDHIHTLLKGFQTGQPFIDPLISNDFKWNNAKHYLDSTATLMPSKRLALKAVKDFRKRMRERGFVGLSYINTDEDETKSNIDPTKTIEDKKCYIVFPQRDKETGWYPMRFRHGAEYDPAKKGKPVLSFASGGEADGMDDQDLQAPENPNGGLMFAPEASDARLQAKMRRDALVASGKRPDTGLPSNPRTVIKAPIAEEGQKQLPDFVTGNINFEDWRKRHEQILDDNEIHHSSKWYKNIYGNFLNYYSDPEKAKKMMRAWLVAQQNVSPAGAMNNVLMQQEQMDRGDPEELWRAGGMPNPTAAARAVLRGRAIQGGVGQKISDFVDSAEGKGTRSWMGDHPHGGSPFVVDVHTARDTGMVDQELINHLSRLGYNPEDLAKLKIDLTTSPSEPAYENRAEFGRKLTDYLNKMGWKGRNDWTPAEIQAVGWMGMTKLTRNAEEDSESGLGRNLRRISYELSPGEGSPWESKYGKAFESLPDQERYNITQKMAESAMDHAQRLSGIDVHSLVHGTGAWENYQNPAAVTQSLSTQRGADIASSVLGHLLQQTEVWHNRVKPMSATPKGFAVDFVEKGSKNLADPDNLRDFWSKVMESDPYGLIRGYQPITLPSGEVGIRALIDKGGLKNQEKLENALKPGGHLDKMLTNLPFDTNTMLHEAEITKHRNDWKENKNGQAYISRLIDLLGYDPSAKLNNARQQLEKEFEQHLDEAHQRQGTSWRGTSKKPLIPTKANGGAINKAILVAMRAKKRSPIAFK